MADTPRNALHVLTPKPAGRFAGGLCIVESGSAESDNNHTAKTDAPSCVADARASIESLNGRCALQHCAMNSTAYIPVSGCRRHGAAGVAKCGE